MHAAVLIEKSWDFFCLGTLPSDNKIDARKFVSSEERNCIIPFDKHFGRTSSSSQIARSARMKIFPGFPFDFNLMTITLNHTQTLVKYYVLIYIVFCILLLVKAMKAL